MGGKQTARPGPRGPVPGPREVRRFGWGWLLGGWLLWVLVVLYPNPGDLAVSLYRVIDPPVDPVAVAEWAQDLPDDPAAVEAAVHDAFPYQHDWTTHLRPWYYPTVDEALASGAGDCKTQAILVASILEAKGVSYRVRTSLTHVWVDWETREPRARLESADAALFQTGDDGRRSWQLPNWDEALPSWSLIRHAWWDLMPPLRRALLMMGSMGFATAAVWPLPLTRRSGVDGPPRRHEPSLRAEG